MTIIDVINTPVYILKTLTVFPINVLGAISPYPTDTIVINVHHNEF
jgi:hypothetical protein